MSGIINRRDLEFQLFEVLDTEALTSRPRYAEHSKETFLAVLFLEAFGHTVIAWIWLRQALAAQRGLQQGALAQGTDAAFYRGKLAACRWFYRWELPKTRQWHELLRSLDDTTLTMPPESF